MQTYEVQADTSIESLLHTLTSLARTDREITLIVPGQVPALSQVDNLSRLRQFAGDQGVRLHAVVSDQVTLGLFRIMGLDASDAPSGGAAFLPDAADRDRALAAEVENMNFDSDAYDRAVREEGLAGPGTPSDRMLADAENMNFDIDELEQTLRAEGVNVQPHAPATAEPPPTPAPTESAPERTRSFFGRLKQMINPAPTSEGAASESALPAGEISGMSNADTAPTGERAWATPGGPAAGDQGRSADSWSHPTAATGGLDVTMPDWLREEPPPYVPERPAAAASSAGNPEVNMPDWLRAEPAPPPAPEPAAPPSVPAAPTMPAWMQPDTAARTEDTTALPAWMQPGTPPPPAPPGEAALPDWLRETGAAPAPAGSGSEATMPDWLREEAPPPAGGENAPDTSAGLQVPDWLRAESTPPAPAAATGSGADATPAMPDWLREATEGVAPGTSSDTMHPVAAWSGDNVVPVPAADRPAEAPTEASPPDWLREGGAMPAAPAAPAEGGTPDWLRESATMPPAPAAPAESETPDWLREGGALAPAPTVAGDVEIPDWLREGTAPAPPLSTTPSASTEEPAPSEQPTGESVPSVPTVPAEATVPPVSAAPTAAEAPPPAPVAPPPAPVPGPEATAFDALGGPRQTPESITSAVQAAEGIDPRTRTLLLFGMALVRLAAPEARAAAEAARRAGLTTEDLRLVVEMAQALGGGPSERLGRRILEG